MSNNVIIVGSGKSANQFSEVNTKNLIKVAVNHGWMVSDKWDYWIRPPDYKGEHPNDSVIVNKKEKSYDDVVKHYGGFKECGYSIMLCSSYYVLYHLKPKNIFYLGADMNYTPDEKGHTHIYGKGIDIDKNGISDPDFMVQRWSNGDKNYLKNIYMRFSNIAKENGCDVWNLSKDEGSRLPYPRIEYNGLQRLIGVTQ